MICAETRQSNRDNGTCRLVVNAGITTRVPFHPYQVTAIRLKIRYPSRMGYSDLTRRGSNRIIGLGLGLQGLYGATNCADKILGHFTIILHNQFARVDSFTNLTKRWVFRFRLNASISSHNLISFGKQFHAKGPYTANARLPKISCLNFGTFRTRSSLDLMEYLLLFGGMIISWM